MRGSVDVVVNTVAVCTLHAGDGFGELAIVSNEPRFVCVLVGVDLRLPRMHL